MLPAYYVIPAGLLTAVLGFVVGYFLRTRLVGRRVSVLEEEAGRLTEARAKAMQIELEAETRR